MLIRYLATKALICCFLICLCFQLQAQNHTIDSLNNELTRPLHDTVKLKVLNALSGAYTNVDAQKKMRYSMEAFSLAQKLHDERSSADAEISIGIAFSIRGPADSAIIFYRRAYDRARKVGYLQAMGRSLNNMGFVYDKLDNSRASLKYYLEALAIFKKLRFERGTNQTSINIGSIYYDLKQYRLAISYYEPCYNSYQAAGDEAGISYALLIIGNTYTQLGDFSIAEAHLNRSLEIRQRLADSNGLALTYKGLGVLRTAQKRYMQAIPLLKKAYAMVVALEDKYEQAAVLLDLTDAYVGAGNYELAEQSALTALANSKAVQTSLGTSESLGKLVKIYQQKGDLRNAFKYQSEYVEAQDSLQQRKALQDVTLIEYGRIRTENAGLQRDNNSLLTRLNRYSNVFVLLGVVLVAALLLLFLQYRRSHERKKANRLLQQQRDEIFNINQVKNKLFSIVAHDLRGPLANLQVLFQLYRSGSLNSEEMNDLLGRLEANIASTSAFLGHLLEWAKNQLEGIQSQPVNFDLVNNLNQNVELLGEQITAKQLHVAVETQAPVITFADPDLIDLVVRNLLSNSVKFCRPGDVIKLSAETRSDKVVFSVSDTGPGISETEQQKLFSLDNAVSAGTQSEKGNHLGLILCRETVQRNNGRLWFESAVGKGTTFWVELPAGKADVA